MGTPPAPRRIVLAVDDEPAIRETLRFLLEETYDVEEAASGLDAIRLVTKPISEDELLEAVQRSFVAESAGWEFPPTPVLVVSDHAGWRSSLAALLSEHVGPNVTAASVANVPSAALSVLTIVDLMDRRRPSASTTAEVALPPPGAVIWADETYAAPFSATPPVIFRERRSVGALVGYATQRLRPAGAPPLTLSGATVKALHVVAHAYPTTTVEDVASVVGLSSRQLFRVFRDDAGVTLKTYLLRVRVEAAKTLLRESSAKLQSIAEQVGLGNASYMARIFRQFEGASPRSHRMSETD